MLKIVVKSREKSETFVKIQGVQKNNLSQKYNDERTKFTHTTDSLCRLHTN